MFEVKVGTSIHYIHFVVVPIADFNLMAPGVDFIKMTSDWYALIPDAFQVQSVDIEQ